jgi:S-DNA-T family DNA segregation ATPase FtsK/SpoIIIE
MKHKPEETKIVLIDTKGYEFNNYIDIPHLLTPLVRETIHTSQILNSLLTGALNRKKIFARNKVKTFDQYNNLVRKTKKKDPNSKLEHLPNIVLIIDDYSLMDNKENKKLLEDLLKINNYTGIHVICGTSLPTEDVITKEMSDYFYTRISFNFVEDDYIKFILGTEQTKHIEGENNYICKTKDNKFYDLQNLLLSNQEITTITDYIKEANK